MANEDRHYFRTRALEERHRASTAPTAEIADIHQQLAAKYEALGEDAELPTVADYQDGGPGSVPA
ncbi:MAG: hypothetical protein ABIN83_05835 [Sphingomicrobium sp.]